MMVSFHCTGNGQAIEFAKQAIKQTEDGDVCYRLSAYSKLAWAYFYDGKRVPALETAQEAEELLLAQKGPIPACIRGGTYSTLALMQARNQLSPNDALSKAIEEDPGDKAIALMEFTRADIPNELGLIYAHSGQQAKAVEKFTEPVGIKSERKRLGSICGLALAALKSPDRDKKEVIFHLTAALQGAQAFKSEWGFNEAMRIYDLAEDIWLGDPDIDELRPLTIHWQTA